MTDADELLGRLRESVSLQVETTKKVAVAYSGGLDSSVVAALTKEIADVQCYCCALEDSYDGKNARGFANQDGLTLKSITPTREDLLSSITETSLILDTRDPVRIAYTVPIMQVLSVCDEELLLTGAGADELFGGYAKYSSHPDPRSAMKEDLEKAEIEQSLIKSAAHALGKRIATPFISKALIEFSESLPIERKITADERKGVLRDVAARLALASSNRPKKAAQYSSGVLRYMEREARNAGKSLADWMAEMSSKSKLDRLAGQSN